MLNQSAEYAVRVVVRLAQLATDGWGQAAELADELEIPANYLSKLMHQLAGAGVLLSRRGRGGGFRLGHPADTLTLAMVVEPFDSPDRYRECFLGGKRCNARSACEAHDGWKPIADRILAFLTETTIAQMAGGSVPGPDPVSRPEASRRRRSRRVSSRSSG